MTTALNISIEPTLMATITSALNNAELGRLMRALTAGMGDSQDDASQWLNNSGLRLAYALLRPAIDEAKQRLATNRANGARGGRPRKHPQPVAAGEQDVATPVKNAKSSKPVSTKKSKKEDLSPTPPLEEKNKKNITLSPHVRADEMDEMERKSPTVSQTVVVPDLDSLQEQLLREQPWLDELCMSRHISQQDMATYIMDFIAYLRERDLRESLSQAKAHFVNQLPYIIKIYKTNNNHENQFSKTSQEFIADPVARRQSERESRYQEACRAIAEVTAEGQRPAIIPF